MSIKRIPTLFYAGSGTDLSPLLIRDLIGSNRSVGLDYLQQDLCFLLCDRSPDITEFFTDLKSKDVLYDAERGIMQMAPHYKHVWNESACKKVIVEETKSLKLSGPDSEIPLLSLDLKLFFEDGSKEKRILHFTSEEFSVMKEFLLTNEHSYDLKGLIALFTIQAREFFDHELISRVDFVITDEAWYHLKSEFLPTNVDFPSWSKGASRAGLKRTKLYLNKSLYPSAQKGQEKLFHIIPNRFVAGLQDSNTSYSSLPKNTKGVLLQSKDGNTEQSGGNNRFPLQKIILNNNSLFQIEEATSTLDKIDSILNTGSSLVLLTDDKQSTLGMIIALWIVRHYVASGDEVFELLHELTKVGKYSLDIVPKAEKQVEMISQWLPGQ